MNLNSKFTKEVLISLYYDNRNYILPAISIFASFFLFFIFIVPQLLSFPERKSEVDIENAKLEKIRQTQRILLSSNEGIVENQLKIVSKALPADKAFEEILAAISQSAALSGAQVYNYQFNNLQSQTSATPSKFSPLLFEVSILGSTPEAVKFIRELYKTYPISDAISINSSIQDTTVKILFYYKSFPSIGPADKIEIKEISPEEKKALDEISKWNEGGFGIIETDFLATESAETGSSPF